MRLSSFCFSRQKKASLCALLPKPWRRIFESKISASGNPWEKENTWHRFLRSADSRGLNYGNGTDSKNVPANLPLYGSFGSFKRSAIRSVPRHSLPMISCPLPTTYWLFFIYMWDSLELFRAWKKEADTDLISRYPLLYFMIHWTLPLCHLFFFFYSFSPLPAR